MTNVVWELVDGVWSCYVHDEKAFEVTEREMNETAGEKGEIEMAKAYYERLYLTPAKPTRGLL